MTRLEVILRDWAGSKDAQKQIALVQYGFGKPPDKIEATGLENKPVLRLHFAHELDDDGQLRPPRVPLPPDADGVHRRWRPATERSLGDGETDGARVLNGEGTRRPLLAPAVRPDFNYRH